MISGITDHDHQHLQTFSTLRKAEVMRQIMSVEPAQNVVVHGNHRFEKAMLAIHREGYGLIDIQSHETAFASVWYRKNRKLLAQSAEVTMLMWEVGEHGDTTTLLSWKI